MSAPKDLLAATLDNNNYILDNWHLHCNGSRVETRTQILSLLRGTFLDHHVTAVSKHSVSLFDFAAAGKAELKLDTKASSSNASRSWHSTGEGIEKKLSPGELKDDFWFARFQYIWEDKEYLVYYACWKDMLESPQENFYILYPKGEDNIVDGHCKETDELALVAGKWTSQLHEEIWVFDDGHWEKSKELWKSVHGSSWDDVILDPEMKKNLIEDVEGFFGNNELYSQFAVPWKRGIILHGVPGNGKTVSIKALISALYARPSPIPSLYVKSIDTKCQTESYSIGRIFEQARKSAPCLLIFEDLDSLVGDDVRSYFLNEVDGLESNDGILMIGSTNHLDKLDAAITKRPSRFDRKYGFKLPAETERTLYAEYWRKKLLKNGTIEFPEELCGVVAKLTDGFSFAYLKELFVMALLSLVRGFKGEDFEIVDAEEADSAPEDGDTTAAKSAPEEKEKEQETCVCAEKCDKCNLPLKGEAGDADACEKKEEQKKHSMPMIDVPESLADNVLLKVIKHQIRTLHAEMDNTKEDQWPSGKAGMGGPKQDVVTFVRRSTRRRG